MSTELMNRIETGHEDMIHDAQMDFYGMRLATCSSDRTIKIYQIKNDAHYLTATLNGHLGPVWQVVWSHPKFGNLLASCSYDKTVCIWKEMGGESSGNGSEWIKSYEYRNHDASVNAIEWAPVAYGLVLVCGSSDGSISFLINDRDTGVWSSKKIPNAHSIGVMAVSWAPVLVDIFALDDDDKNELENHRKRIVSGGCDNLIKIWIEDMGESGGGDAGNEMGNVNWREETRLDLHTDWVRDVSWSPWLRSGTEMFASCSQDGKVVVWHRKLSEDDSWTPTILNKFTETVWNVSWSLSGDVLAVSHGQSENSLWRLDAEHKWISLDDGAAAGSGGSITEAPSVPQRSSGSVVHNDHQV